MNVKDAHGASADHQLSALLDQSSPRTMSLHGLEDELVLLVAATESSGRHRWQVRRRVTVGIVVGAIAFSGASAAAAAPLIGRAIYHPTPAYPLSGTPVQFEVEYGWTSRASGRAVPCTSTMQIVLSGQAESRLVATKTVIETYYRELDVRGIQSSREYKDRLGIPKIGQDPSKAEGSRVAEMQTLTEILNERLTPFLDKERLGTVARDGSGSHVCADDK